MKKLMEYKGYHAKIDYSVEDDILFGTVIGIDDAITFEGSCIDELKQGFHDMIDDYLIICEEIGKEPEKEFKGTFNIRISPELHKQAVLTAADRDLNLNQFVAEAISHEVEGFPHKITEHIVTVVLGDKSKPYSFLMEKPNFGAAITETDELHFMKEGIDVLWN